MPADPSVELIVDGQTIGLDDTPVELPERRMGLRVTGSPGARVYFDDSEMEVLFSDDGATAFGTVDLQGQSGHHRISVRSAGRRNDFDICTASGKATWEQVRTMALCVGREAFAFRRQFVYSTPTRRQALVRLPEVEFGWFRERLEQVLRLAHAVDRRPARARQSQLRTSLCGGRVDLSSTVKHIHQNPGLLTAHSGGPLRLGDERYWPEAVRVRAHVSSAAIEEHRRVARFLRALSIAASRLAGSVSGTDEKRQVARWLTGLAEARNLQSFRPYLVEPMMPSASSRLPSIIERSDSRYSRLRQLGILFERGFDPGERSQSGIRVNVRDAWEIYQAYVGHVVGSLLELEYTSKTGDLRDRDALKRSMHSERYDLYYDTKPPGDVLRSWRSTSARPADERPDILVHDRVQNRVAVVDVKFRADATGRARQDDLFEMQGYMQSFGIRAGGIVYPSDRREPVSIEGDGYALSEIPLRPAVSVADVQHVVLSALDRLWTSPPP